MPGVIRPIHILWNQVIGFIFIVLAIVFGFRVVRGKEPLGLQLVGCPVCPLDGVVWRLFLLEARKISKS